MDFLTTKVKTLGLSDKVHFMGERAREEILSFLKLADIFIMVSAPETFGLVYLEAMAKGNIIIGCKNNGIDGIIVDRKNGFLVEARNVEHLVSCINNIYNSSPEEKGKILDEIEQTILNLTNESTAENYLRSINNEK
jgi:glycosyltransferase involved in cell wall biosynthesis